MHTPRPLTANPIHQQFGTATQMMAKVYRGELPGMIFYGPPGLGKTHTGEEVAHQHNQPWRTHRPGSMIGLIRIIKKQKRGVAAFDDIDYLWDDPRTVNTLKTLLDPRGRRFLEHIVGGSPTNSIKRFEVPSGVGGIFLSNRNFHDRKQFRCDIVPVLDRCAVIGLSFDPLDAYEYTGWLAVNGMLRNLHKKMPGGHIRHISLIEANEVLAHFAANAARYRNIAPRSLIKFAEWRIGEQYDRWSPPWLTRSYLKDPDRTRRLPTRSACFPDRARNSGGVAVPMTTVLSASSAPDPLALRLTRVEAGTLADMMAAVAETGVPIVKTN